MKDFQDIYRKVNIRKESENNCNYNEGNSENKLMDKLHFGMLENKIITLNTLWNVNYDFEIFSHRKITGPIIIFFKRAVRKLLKWYVRDTGIKQNTFNSYSVQAINGIWEYINEQNSKNQNIENCMVQIRKKNENLEYDIEALKEKNQEAEQDIKNLKEKNQELEKYLKSLTNAISSNEKNFSDTLNNVLIKQNEDISYLKYRIKSLCNKRNCIQVDEDKCEKIEDNKIEKIEVSGEIDYFDFENKFRGSEVDTQKRQEIYLPYFRNTNKVILDIGCGRGEFLTMLSKNNMEGKGTDICLDFVDYCKYKGLDVELEDAISMLSKFEDNSLGGVFMGQIAEHLQTDYLIKLLNLCRDKISIGGKIVVETPNPETIRILGDTFYIDPSHIKPIHPLQLKYIVESAGFKNIETLYLHEFDEKIPYPIGLENKEEFNNSVDKLNRLLYGPRDYSIIAEK